jgi:hypothetical protein
MGLFTVELEIGPETRAMIERLATTALLQLELGPETRKTIGETVRMPEKGGTTREAIGGLLGKGGNEEG